MKLKEKIQKLNLSTWISQKDTEKIEIIADEYAIGFSEWCIEWRVEFVDDTREGMLYTYSGMYQKYTMNEILEIYKKEKGL
jgi:hypothetical protein